MTSPEFGRNLIDMFQSMAAGKKDRPFLWAKRDGAYRSWSWQQVAYDAGGHALKHIDQISTEFRRRSWVRSECSLEVG